MLSVSLGLMPFDPSVPAADDLALWDELTFLARALRAHVEYQSATGTIGVPKAPPIQRAPTSITEPPPSLAPAAAIRSAASGPVSLPAAVTLPLGESVPRISAGSGSREADPGAFAQALNDTSHPSDHRARTVTTPSASQPIPAPRAVPTPVNAEEKRRQLELLAQEITGCTQCALCQRRKQTVFARGTGSCGLCFVGEGPGADEDAQGYPFVGAAGQLLDKMIAAMGLGRDEVYVCNIVKCRPPENRKPLPEEMLACRPYLERQLEILAPEVIVALGATAVEGLLGTTGGITRLRGTWKLYKGRTAVMPTFHPAYLLRSPSAKHAVWDDMQAVLRQMGRPVPSRGKR